MIDDTVHGAIVAWLAGVTGATVIRAYQSAPPPAEPYIAVGLDATREISAHPIELPIVATGETTSEGKAEVEQAPAIEREWQFGLQGIGAGAEGLLRKIKVAAHVNYLRQDLYPLKLHEVGEVNRLPDERNQRWESRAACDLFLRGITRDGVLIETIESAPVTISRTA